MQEWATGKKVPNGDRHMGLPEIPQPSPLLYQGKLRQERKVVAY